METTLMHSTFDKGGFGTGLQVKNIIIEKIRIALGIIV